MAGVTESQFAQRAAECIDNMGDVFWDYKPERDDPLDFKDPVEIATAAVAEALGALADELDTRPAYSVLLQEEYEAATEGLRPGAPDSAVVAVLVRDAEWTEQGAREIVALARRYGVFGLRNALALAAALEIEDGDGGL